MSRPNAIFLYPVVLAILTLHAVPAVGQVPSTITEQLTTAERIEKTKWWPTKGKASRDQYLGSQACALCHGVLVKSQAQHSMAKTSVHAPDSSILLDHNGESFRLGAYQYKVLREPDGRFDFSVSEPAGTATANIDWAFGAGKVGQSYLSEQQGSFHEVRFSYFSTLHAFDVTPNQSGIVAASGANASGRVLPQAEAQRCFGCHTTASTVDGKFQPANAIPGVSCEACHGPGSQHVAAMKAGEIDAGIKLINDPGKLTPVELVDFCGACHTTWWDAKRIGATGVANVRFHPYRLESSRCWGNGDLRLTCPSCHDPHQPLVRDASAYDSRCLSCHVQSRDTKPQKDHLGSACPVAKNNCVTCHMPKYEVPDMHYSYTDHKIQIVKSPAVFAE